MFANLVEYGKPNIVDTNVDYAVGPSQIDTEIVFKMEITLENHI